MATIKKACKGVSYPKSSSVSGRLGSPSKAKSGKMLKKQAAVAIAMKAAGKKPKMAKGGSFPDLNKDGKVTKKDVLIGRGVLPETAKKGMKVKKAQDGNKLKRIQGRYVKTRDKIEAKEDAGMAVSNRLKNKSARLETKIGNLTSNMRYSPITGYYKKGGSVKKSMKTGGKMTKKCMYGCK